MTDRKTIISYAPARAKLQTAIGKAIGEIAKKLSESMDGQADTVAVVHWIDAVYHGSVHFGLSFALWDTETDPALPPGDQIAQVTLVWEGRQVDAWYNWTKQEGNQTVSVAEFYEYSVIAEMLEDMAVTYATGAIPGTAFTIDK